jgi:hypothetical protein
MCPWNSIVWLQWNCCCEQNIKTSMRRIPASFFPDPTQTNGLHNHNVNFTHDIKRSENPKSTNPPKETKQTERPRESRHSKKQGQQSLELQFPKNGGNMPHPPRRPIPRTLHPPTRHRLANPAIPALPPRAPAPPRSSPDSLPRKCRGPASHADPAGRTPCERDWSPRGVLARPEGASGC